jgi:glycosyltransferase involved in cell wall biosynthesis
MEGPLKAQAASLGLGDAVRFLGLVPNDEVAALQGGADLFVLSSVLEATPTVALEALACGTPVVSTDNPGGLELREIFGPDVAVVPKADAATARHIAERFRLDGVAERYLGLYAEAMAS